MINVLMGQSLYFKMNGKALVMDALSKMARHVVKVVRLKWDTSKKDHQKCKLLVILVSRLSPFNQLICQSSMGRSYVVYVAEILLKR